MHVPRTDKPADRERLITAIPGPRSRAFADRLHAVESRGVTYLAEDFPVFWRSGNGATITDVDGNQFLDLTAAFGVAALGHGNPRIAQALALQAQRLTHGMGDVHPGDVRTELLERLSSLAPIANNRVFLCSTGADAVEFARKTTMLATGKPDMLAFEGAYHGLSYGALELCGNPTFRTPWESQLRNNAVFVPFPAEHRHDPLEQTFARIDEAFRVRPSIGAIIVEPIQGRAGALIPPDGFLTGLRMLCDQYGALLIFDEIFTGFGRTGTMFAAQHENVEPDLLCLGKALGGGFPISAVVGKSAVMDAWKPSTGEALHTSTYLGNPLGCAAALAVLEEIERLHIPERAREVGAVLDDRLRTLGHSPAQKSAAPHCVRGRGALWALEFENGDIAHRIVVRALARGLIILQAGMHGESIQITPPLIIERDQLDHAVEILTSVVREETLSR